jgi:hypothetical protein
MIIILQFAYGCSHFRNPPEKTMYRCTQNFYEDWYCTKIGMKDFA